MVLDCPPEFFKASKISIENKSCHLGEGSNQVSHTGPHVALVMFSY